MKKYVNYVLMAVLTLVIASCTKDSIIDEGGQTSGKGIRLVISGLNSGSVTTYAGEVDPIGNESLINDNKVTLYQFNYAAGEAGFFNAKYDVSLTANAQGKLESIVEVTGTGSEYIYYVVANAAEAKADTKLATVSTSMTESQFLELLTNEAASAEHLKTPLLLTGKSEKKGLIGYCDVTLYRSVARFDIQSKADAQGRYLDIKKVVIRSAKTQGEIFFDGPGTTTIPAGQIKDLPHIPGTDLNLTSSSNSDNNGNDILEQKSVFYLYPTEVDAMKTGATTISIVASYNNGPDQVYTVNGPVEIRPNSRYILTAIPGVFKLGLRVANWDEGSEHKFEELDDLRISGFSATGGTGSIIDETNYRVNPGESTTITFDLLASSKQGTSYEVEGSAQNTTITVTPGTLATDITYSVPGYKQSYTINVATGDSRSFEIPVKITDIATGINSIITLYGTNAPANSYIVSPGGNSVLFPVYTQINRAMVGGIGTIEENKLLPNNWIESSKTYAAAVLWSDRTGDIINKVEYVNDKDDFKRSYIKVVSGAVEGNSVIALFEDVNENGSLDDGEEIKWSWHIWNTDYNPYVLTSVPALNGPHTASGMNGSVYRHNTKVYTVSGSSDNVFMDRNLGAIVELNGSLVKAATTGGNKDAYGLLYQWGRKDPLPTYEQKASFATGNQFKVEVVTETNNLKNSIHNPLTFYTNKKHQSYDWYTSGIERTSQNDHLWGGEQGEDKSVFDPCPEGWRVPAGNGGSYANNATPSPWYGGTSELNIDHYNADWSSEDGVYFNGSNYNLGFYPLAGYRYPYVPQGGALGDYLNLYDRYSGTQVPGIKTGIYWFASSYKGAGGPDVDDPKRFAETLQLLHNPYEPSTNFTWNHIYANNGVFRAYSQSVRCVKN